MFDDCAASLVVTFGLIWLSCHMLDMDVNRTVFFTGAIVVMTFTLNGLAPQIEPKKIGLVVVMVARTAV